MPSKPNKNDYEAYMETAATRFKQLIAQAERNQQRTIGYAEIARHMGLTRGAVSGWAKRPTLEHERQRCIELAQVFRTHYGVDVNWRWLYLGEAGSTAVDWEAVYTVNWHIAQACRLEGVTIPCDSKKWARIFTQLWHDYQRDGQLQEQAVRNLILLAADEPQQGQNPD